MKENLAGFCIKSNIKQNIVQPAVLITCTTAVANKCCYLSQFIVLWSNCF